MLVLPELAMGSRQSDGVDGVVDEVIETSEHAPMAQC
jgi:hypothetical protein